ncbi:putative reverse transcriptase domain-containing protein [Tanacetum coccineum]
MSFAEIEQIVAQRVANAIEAIAVYETKIRMAYDSIDQVALEIVNERKRPTTSVMNLSLLISFLSDIAPSTLDIKYTIELADEKVIGADIIIRGCTLNLLSYPFNINLMPIELGSFDVIIGMDWLTKYHVVIIYNEKIVRIMFGNESNSKLNIISCTKNHEYIQKGCHVFLAKITKKKKEDKSEEKRLKDVPIVRDFLEVFPEDLPGLPPT